LKLEFEDMAKDNSPMLLNRWFKIVDNENKISLVYPKSWTFENQRIYTEISLELNSEKQFVLSSPMEVKSIWETWISKTFEDLPLKIQVETLLEFVEGSTLCLGCSFPGDSGILYLPFLPHKVGMLKPLNDPEISQQNHAFSSACEMIVSSGNQCPKCHRLKRRYQLRKERKEKRVSISIAIKDISLKKKFICNCKRKRRCGRCNYKSNREAMRQGVQMMTMMMMKMKAMMMMVMMMMMTMMMMMMMKRKMMRKAMMMMKRKMIKRKRKIILVVWSDSKGLTLYRV